MEWPSNVQVRNLRTGALHSMLAVGTAMPGGEDTPCRGRVILFEISWQMVDGATKCVSPLLLSIDALSRSLGSVVPLLFFFARLVGLSTRGRDGRLLFARRPFSRLRDDGDGGNDDDARSDDERRTSHSSISEARS